MVKKAILILSAALSLAGSANAQWCITDEQNKVAREQFPQMVEFEKQLEKEMMKLNLVQMKTTADDSIFHVPVVFHVIHNYDDYGAAYNYVPDNQIYQLMDHINEVYRAGNADLSEVIAPFKKYIGNPHMVFHMATKDPLGRPTIGITHRQSYLSNGGDNQAKFDLWAPDRYLNIWIIQRIGRGIANGLVAAYATPPSSAAANPFGDGVITNASLMLNNKTIPHEIGHIFNLSHTWGDGEVAVTCGDDGVDDTPPTTGHFGSAAGAKSGNCNLPIVLYDTTCTTNAAPLGKAILDTTINGRPIRTSTQNHIGIDFVARTGINIQSVDIYPSVIGGLFDIALMRYNKTTGNFDTLDKHSNNSFVNVGRPAIVNASSSTTATSKEKAGILFTANKPLIIETVDIYPTTINDTFRIILYSNNDTLGSYVGLTNTTTGAQTVPVNFFVPKTRPAVANPPRAASNYSLVVVRNPGLLRDTVRRMPLADSNVANIITLNQSVDTSTTSGTYRSYNLLYKWNVRHKGITSTDSSVQNVPLDFSMPTDSGYRLAIIKNPGLRNDSVIVPLYSRNISCVIQIKDDTTNGRYNFIYNWALKYGYVRNCIDYPDTVNTQNIMDYADCPKNFTELQVTRMRNSVRSDVGNRDKLVSKQSHIAAGILDANSGQYGLKADLPPVPDFSVERTGTTATSVSGSHYLCANEVDFVFRNRSWGDTITSVAFEVPNGNPSTSSSITAPFRTKATQPGWLTVKLTATGNNTGSSPTERTPVYAADPSYIIDPIKGYYQDFNNEQENAKWPIFNYYDNQFKWSLASNTGYYDNSCIVYNAYDNRIYPNNLIGAPGGDLDDFFSPAFDLSSMATGNCNLNFMYSSATRVTNPDLMLDKLEIAYSSDCGTTWRAVTTREGKDIANKGTYENPYSPLWLGDWALASINIPTEARKSSVYFRFRYRPGSNPEAFTLTGVGNNFYMDRINVSNFPLGMNTVVDNSKQVAIAPNPTTGSSYVVIQNTGTSKAQVQVTDIAGRVVYRTEAQLQNAVERIEIPASAISVKGMYLVHIITGTQTFTEKLVSN